jgi:hypothetical protein
VFNALLAVTQQVNFPVAVQLSFENIDEFERVSDRQIILQLLQIVVFKDSMAILRPKYFLKRKLIEVVSMRSDDKNETPLNILKAFQNLRTRHFVFLHLRVLEQFVRQPILHVGQIQIVLKQKVEGQGHG